MSESLKIACLSEITSVWTIEVCAVNGSKTVNSTHNVSQLDIYTNFANLKD